MPSEKTLIPRALNANSLVKTLTSIKKGLTGVATREATARAAPPSTDLKQHTHHSFSNEFMGGS